MSTDMATMVKTVVDVATKVAGEIVMEKSNQREAECRVLHELTSNGNFNEDDRLYDKAISTRDLALQVSINTPCPTPIETA